MEPGRYTMITALLGEGHECRSGSARGELPPAPPFKGARKLLSAVPWCSLVALVEGGCAGGEKLLMAHSLACTVSGRWYARGGGQQCPPSFLTPQGGNFRMFQACGMCTDV
jgi:hypothetical protein